MERSLASGGAQSGMFNSCASRVSRCDVCPGVKKLGVQPVMHLHASVASLRYNWALAESQPRFLSMGVI